MKRFLILLWLLPSMLVFGQRRDQRDYITVQMVPNHADWVYASNEEVQITPLDCAHWQYPEHKKDRHLFVIGNW